MVDKEDASLAKVEMRAELQREVVRHVLAGGIEAGHLVLNGKSASEDRAEIFRYLTRFLKLIRSDKAELMLCINHREALLKQARIFKRASSLIGLSYFMRPILSTRSMP